MVLLKLAYLSAGEEDLQDATKAVDPKVYNMRLVKDLVVIPNNKG